MSKKKGDDRAARYNWDGNDFEVTSGAQDDEDSTAPPRKDDDGPPKKQPDADKK